MAAALGCGSASGSWISLNNNNSSLISKMNSSNQKKRRGFNYITCASSSSALTMDPYKTLRINPDASESEVRKSFRQLALQYHPDVCRGSNCGVQFHHINEAYDMVMSNLRGETGGSETENNVTAEYNPDEPMWGMHDSDWEHWEEWMGWEGAGIRDYSSHINPAV